MNNVKVVDKGWRRIKREIQSAGDQHITAGLHQEEAGSSNPNNVQKGVFNEFGTSTAPARPFVSATHDLKKGEWIERIKLDLNKVIDGKMTFKELLNDVGWSAAADIKKYVIDLKAPPNAPATIAKKGFDDPLIETGEMRDAITYKIRK